MRNRGQGFDTFKLLIAAIVALVILGILASILGGINPSGLSCVGSPISEITSNVQKATTGQIASTQKLCLREREGFSATAIGSRLSGISVMFKCDTTDALVCQGDNPALVIAPDGSMITATRQVEFKAIIECETASSCKILISNPPRG